MNRMFAVIALVFAAAPLAAAQQTLECGARIVSNQTFEGNRLCLALTDTTDRARVGLRTCSPNMSDQSFLWKIVRRNGGGLHIISATSGQERRMEVADFNKNNGATIQIWGPNVGEGYRNQTWDFFPAGDGVIIVSVDSGKCLNVPLGRNRLDQEFLQQFTCERRPNDTWKIEPVLGGADRNCR